MYLNLKPAMSKPPKGKGWEYLFLYHFTNKCVFEEKGKEEKGKQVG
jgi:hypothetical protein